MDMENNRSAGSGSQEQPEDREHRAETGQTAQGEALAAEKAGGTAPEDSIGREAPAGTDPKGKPGKRAPKTGIILSGVLLLILLGIVAGVMYAQNRMLINIRPVYTEAGSSRVAPDTYFHIEISNGAVSLEELYGMVSVNPDIPFFLTGGENGVFDLKPRQILEVDTELVIRVKNKTARFQVADLLVAVSHFPSDGGRQVPVTSGIEFQFNKDVALDVLEESVSISPPVPGYFSTGDGRYVFYPDGYMEGGATYTVTLSEGLAATDGAPLARELSFSFRTITEREEELQRVFQLSSDSVASNTLTTETALLQIYLDSEFDAQNNQVDVTVYAVDTWREYYTLLWENTQDTGRALEYSTVETDGYSQYASFSLSPIPTVTDGYYSYSYGNRWLLEFPDVLPEGWYLIDLEIEMDGIPLNRQAFLQVSDLSVYSMTMDRHMLVWVNDAATGQPVQGAQIEVEGAYRAKGETDADGTMYIEEGVPNTEDAVGGSTVFTVAYDGRTFVGLDYYYSYYNLYEDSVIANQYISYLFTDRPIYRTTDTIEVWGVYRPRHDGIQQPTEAKLKFYDESVEEQTVPIGGDGTFRTTISYQYIASGYNSLQLFTADGVFLQSLYLGIEDYEKPIYTASTGTDKPAYMQGYDDRILVDATVSMFDGTPASSFGLNFSGPFQSERQLVTDAEGRVQVELDPSGAASENTWYPRHYTYGFGSTEAQQEYFYYYGSFYIIHRDVMLRGKSTFRGNSADLEVTTHMVDVSGVETPADLWREDALKGAAVSRTVTAQLQRVYYEKVETPGSVYYDYVTRTTKRAYEYQRREVEEWIQTFETTGGSYLLEDLPLSGDGESYYVILTSTDSLGRKLETQIYLGSGYYYNTYGNNGGNRYSFNKVTNPADLQEVESDGEIWYTSNTTMFRDGEDVQFDILHNDGQVEDFSGRVFYTVVQDDFSFMGISDQPRVALGFDERLVPNYVLMGAYFDGKHIFALEDIYMSFDEKSRKLDINLEPDREFYGPGDAVQVTATVTDAGTGQRVEGSTVVLSVVDEAVFAIMEQRINILETIYYSVYYPSVRKYTSYIPFENPGAGEKGGGGGDDVRTDFEDTVYFGMAATGTDGTAGFSFNLPDNITSWRLTSLTLTGNNRAGSVRTNVKATMDYYVMPILNQRLLSGDSLSVGLYSAGVGVGDNDGVEYTVTLSGNGTSRQLAQISTVRGYASVDFGPVTSGQYTVLIEGRSGAYRDAVQLPVEVVGSGIEVSNVKTFRLGETIAVDALRNPMSITFYSASARTYNQMVRSVMSSDYGTRVDARIARAAIAHIRLEQGVEWYDEEALSDKLSDFYSYSPLQVFPYSNYDLALTVKAYLAAPEIVGIGRIESLAIYDQYELDNWSEALVCLAEALSGAEEKHVNMDKLLEHASELDYVDQVYLAMALAVSGDQEAAGEWYQTLVSDNLAKITGVSGQQIYYIETDASGRLVEDCTAAAAMLATMLDRDDARYLLGYLVQKPSVYEPYILEKLYYITRNSDVVGGDSPQISYQRNGETVTLDLNRSQTVSFSQLQLAEADFKALSGESYADVYYFGAPTEKDATQNLIGLSKTVEAVDGTFAPGALVRITIVPDYSRVDTTVGRRRIVVEDYIPSGMRFEKVQDVNYDRGWYFNRREGQRVQFTVHNPDKQPRIVYYARCSTPGDYVVESAYASSMTGAAWGSSERDMITIQP